MKGTASLEPMALEQDQRITEVVKREQSRLRNFIRRRVPDPRDAEDILQPRSTETLLQERVTLVRSVLIVQVKRIESFEGRLRLARLGPRCPTRQHRRRIEPGGWIGRHALPGADQRRTGLLQRRLACQRRRPPANLARCAAKAAFHEQ